jgi:hypothetical protein
MDEAPFASTTKRRSDSLLDAIRATNPGIQEAYAERLELEEQIRAGATPTDDRTRWPLLFEPFEVLAPEMERGCAETRLDLTSMLGFLGTLAAVILSIFIAEFVPEIFNGKLTKETWLIWAILVSGFVGSAFTLWRLYLGGRRWLERKVIPHICRSLSPIRPTREELSEIIGLFKARGAGFARFLRLKAFDSCLNSDEAQTTPSKTPLTPR